MNLESLKLLYVEDEKDLQDAMQSILEDEVDEFILAKNGEEGFNLYKKHSPHIMLVDINLPKLNGLDLVKKIRAQDQNTRIIMLTAYSDIENLLAATELKLTKYLIKPFDGDELFEALDLAVSELNKYNIITKTHLDMKENFTWDYSQNLLYQNNDEIRLTPKEKKILDILFSNLNSVISYDTILMDVWEDFEQYSLDTLKTMMKNIRRKLPKDVIENVYGIGYKVTDKSIK